MNPKNDHPMDHPMDHWFRGALSACGRGSSGATRDAVLARITGRSPRQLSDARRARLFLPASAAAAAVLMGLWTWIMIRGPQPERASVEPIEQVQNALPPILALEEDGLFPESGAPTILSDLLTGEFSE